MISQQTKKELSYLWNQAKDLFSFDETFVEPINPDLNAPENKKYLEIIEAFKWDHHWGALYIRNDKYPNGPDYNDALTKGTYTAGDIIRARLAFNAARATVRYFTSLAYQDKFSPSAINDFYTLENILVPNSTFDADNISVALATPFRDNLAANINVVFGTANHVASCRYTPGEFILNKEDVFNKKTRSFSNLDAVSLLDRADKGEDEFDLTKEYPDDNRKIDEALHAVDEYCIRDAFLETALKEAGYMGIPFDDLKDAITLAAPELMKISESKDRLDDHRWSYEDALVINEKEGYIRAIKATMEDFLGNGKHTLKNASELGVKTKLDDGLEYTLTAMTPSTHKDYGYPDLKMRFAAPSESIEPDGIGSFETVLQATDFSTKDLKAISEQLESRLIKARDHELDEQISTGPFGDSMRLLKDRADFVAAKHKYDNLPALRRLFTPRPKETEGAPTTAELMDDCAMAAEETFLEDTVVSDNDGTMTLTIYPADQSINHDKEDLLRLEATYNDIRSGREFKTVHEIPITPDGRLTFESRQSSWGKNYREDTPAMMFYNDITDKLRRFVEGGCKGIVSKEKANSPLWLTAPWLTAPKPKKAKNARSVELKATDSLTPTPGGYILNTGNGFRLLDKDRHDTLGGITVDAFSQIQNNVSVARIGDQYALVNLKTNKPLGGTLRLFSYAGEMTPDGLALIRTKDLRFNYLKPDGTFLSKEGFEQALPFKDGKASVTRGGRNFVIDSKGVVVEAEQLKTQQTLNKGMKV